MALRAAAQNDFPKAATHYIPKGPNPFQPFAALRFYVSYADLDETAFAVLALVAGVSR